MENSATPLELLRTSLKTTYLETIRNNKYIPHAPTPKQLEFLLCFNHEVFFGGAAGGGKSDALLMAALQYVMYPDYHAIIFRRTFQDLSLPGALMDRTAEWLEHTDAKWNSERKTWKFPSGATLTFGYLEYERQKFRYQSANFHFVAFDELTQFTESQYVYLFSRNRKAEGCPIPLRTRSASNPGGLGHLWVKKRFVDHNTASSLVGRRFIPSKLSDNPYLDQETYLQNLNELDYVQRLQLRDGDWDVVQEGNMFKQYWFKYYEHLPSNLRYIRYWDLAATEKSAKSLDPDWTVGVKLGVTPDESQVYIVDVARDRTTPDGVDQMILNTAMKDGRETLVCIEQEGGSSGKLLMNHYEKMLRGFGFKKNPPSKNKVSRATPFSTYVEQGRVFLKRADWNEQYLYELGVFPNGLHDDQVDASSGAFNEAVTVSSKIEMARV